MQTIDIWTLAVDNDSGIEATVHPSAEAADAELFSWVKAWWELEYPGKAMPEGREEAMRAYFEAGDLRAAVEHHTLALPLPDPGTLATALHKIAERWPPDAEPPQAEDYHDTESAYNNGTDVASYECALIARQALVAPAMPEDGAVALLAEACQVWAAQFDGTGDSDLNVSGADLVDWFTEWRGRAKRTLAGDTALSRVEKTRRAVALLRQARNLLADAPRAQERVRSALRSAEGAVRNARCHEVFGESTDEETAAGA